MSALTVPEFLPWLFPSLFLMACAVYVGLDLWLVHGLKRLGAARREASEASAIQGTPGHRSNAPVISVLIAARDEERNLPQTLEALLAQDWPRTLTQIIVVDDRSVDATGAILHDYAARFPDLFTILRVDTLPPGVSPKKHALARGLEVARGAWIAVTDADCTMGPQWLTTLADEFGPEDGRIGMVVGITAYDSPSEGFSPAAGAQALEFISYGVTAAALVGLGFPVIANANNIAYRRRAFDDAGSFARHGAIVSGDDDFTLQEIHATGRWDIRYCARPEGGVRTTAPATWGAFWEQRKRWAGKCLHYRAPQLAFLIMVYSFYAAILGLLIVGLLPVGGPLLGILGIAGFALKSAADFMVMRAGLGLLGHSALLRYFPFTALLHIPLILAAVVAGSLGSFTWKGQRMARVAKPTS